MPTSPSLPVLPVPHARALAALQDPDGDIAELAVAIEGDPALTMAVLRAANSAASHTRPSTASTVPNARSCASASTRHAAS